MQHGDPAKRWPFSKFNQVNIFSYFRVCHTIPCFRIYCAARLFVFVLKKYNRSQSLEHPIVPYKAQFRTITQEGTIKLPAFLWS